MTIPYNASLFTIIQYIKNILKQYYYTNKEIKILKQNNEIKNKLKIVKDIAKNDKLKKISNI